MASVTLTPEGDVVIRCSVDEALAVEVVTRAFHSDEGVNQLIHGVWDGLDDLRQVIETSVAKKGG